MNPIEFNNPDRFPKTGQVHQVHRIGLTAKQLLDAPGCAGQILAVVSSAVCLTTRDSDILWLVQEGLPAHTRAILTSFDPRLLSVGIGFAVEDARLRIGDDIALDLRGAEEWRPATIVPAQPAPLDVVSARVRELQVALARSVLGGAASLGCVVEGCGAEDARNDITRIARACRELIGLGAGLTPAGDDFVGGLLFAVHHLHKTYPAVLHWDAQPIEALMDYARAQTNRISFAILSDLARGDGPEPLHDFVAALLTGKNVDALLPPAARVVEIGSTTGRNILEGTLAGIDLIASPE